MSIRGGEKGFTLIDVAVMMLIVGLLAVPFMQKLHAEDMKYKRKITHDNIDAINQAVADYYFQWGYYPCPADLTKSPADADYGQEVRVAGACATAGAGVTEADGRDVDGVAPAEKLMIGGVPFASLHLPVSVALDGWSGKFSYAVSRPLTQGAINFDFGVIAMWGFYEDPPGQNPPVYVEGQLTDRAHYALISHGENGVGGYSAEGVLMEPCPAAGAAAPKEQRNCNYTGRFYFGEMETSMVQGPNYNDDITYSQDSVPTRIWVEAVGDDIVSGVQNIGVGTRTPIQDPAVQLNVMGNVQATGSAYAVSLCSPAPHPAAAAVPPVPLTAPANCHSPQVIGGIGMGCWTNDPNMNPPPAAGGMTGIAGASEDRNLYNFYDGAKCKQNFLVGAVVSSTCPPGQAATGIDASGGVVCGAL